VATRGEINSKTVLIRVDKMYERDGHTHGHTDTHTPHSGIGRACTASRGKNY